MTSIERLTELFGKFPGIGPRQARRFVYYLLTRSQAHNDELSRMVKSLKGDIIECAACHRFFEQSHTASHASHKAGSEDGPLCSIDRDPNRDASVLMLVSRDVDFESIEKTGSYKGRYFILGGSVPILEKKPEERIRERELVESVKKRLATEGLKEIILAVNATPEGEHTADYVERLLGPIIAEKTAQTAQGESGVKISRLGKGVSTGTELEYSDSDTISYALKNRG